MDPRTCLKCEFLDSTPDPLPWRCRALRSHILASPQGDSDAHLSLRATVLVGGEAMEECLPCSQQKGHCSFRDGSTAGLEGPLVDEVIAQVLPRYQGTNLPLGILTQRSRICGASEEQWGGLRGWWNGSCRCEDVGKDRW